MDDAPTPSAEEVQNGGETMASEEDPSVVAASTAPQQDVTDTNGYEAQQSYDPNTMYAQQGGVDGVSGEQQQGGGYGGLDPNSYLQIAVDPIAYVQDGGNPDAVFVQDGVSYILQSYDPSQYAQQQEGVDTMQQIIAAGGSYEQQAADPSSYAQQGADDAGSYQQQQGIESASYEQQGMDTGSFEQQGLAQQGLVQQELAQQSIATSSYEQQGLAQQGLAQQSIDTSSYQQQGLEQQGLAQQSIDTTSYEQQGLEQQGLAQQSIDTSSYGQQSIDATSFQQQALAQQSVDTSSYEQQGTSYEQEGISYEQQGLTQQSVDSSSYEQQVIVASSGYEPQSADAVVYIKPDLDAANYEQQSIENDAEIHAIDAVFDDLQRTDPNTYDRLTDTHSFVQTTVDPGSYEQENIGQADPTSNEHLSVDTENPEAFVTENPEAFVTKHPEAFEQHNIDTGDPVATYEALQDVELIQSAGEDRPSLASADDVAGGDTSAECEQNPVEEGAGVREGEDVRYEQSMDTGQVEGVGVHESAPPQVV